MEHIESDQLFGMDSDYQSLIQGREWQKVPERRLLFAVLERTVRDCLGNQPEEALAARNWLIEDYGDTETPFSFGWISQQLEIDGADFKAKVFRALSQLSSSKRQGADVRANIPKAA